MKNVFFLLAVCCSILAQADTYDYLIFTNTEGSKTAFGVVDLTLNVDGSNLQVTNSNGTVSLILTDLASMQFSQENTATGVEHVLDADAPVQVFSVSGSSLGSYGSLMEAAQMLSTGVYVISNGRVNQMVVIRN
jgi:hypothetical protein